MHIDGDERSRLGRGDFFGEISALTGDAPSADVVATSLLRCLVIPATELEEFLVARPRVMLRMLQSEARRLQTAGQGQYQPTGLSRRAPTTSSSSAADPAACRRATG